MYFLIERCVFDAHVFSDFFFLVLIEIWIKKSVAFL